MRLSPASEIIPLTPKSKFTMLSQIKEIAKAARLRKRFRPMTVTLDAKTAPLFVAMRTDPRQFVPKVFEGEWAIAGEVAKPNEIKLLAAVLCPGDVVQILGRQDGRLFAYTASQPRRRD
jgi:hypothetical protein